MGDAVCLCPTARSGAAVAARRPFQAPSTSFPLTFSPSLQRVDSYSSPLNASRWVCPMNSAHTVRGALVEVASPHFPSPHGVLNLPSGWNSTYLIPPHSALPPAARMVFRIAVALASGRPCLIARLHDDSSLLPSPPFHFYIPWVSPL